MKGMSGTPQKDNDVQHHSTGLVGTGTRLKLAKYVLWIWVGIGTHFQFV